MVDEFLNTLAETNRSHLFYVDWSKARRNQEFYKDELALLQILSNEGIDPKAELARLISKYPRINTLIPLLVACRVKSKKGLQRLTVIDENNATNLTYDFSSKELKSEDIAKTIVFAERVGLLHELANIKNPADYYFGIEVGMDTNARKNRSGHAMEGLVEEHIRVLVDKHKGKYLTQKTFKTAADLFGVQTPIHQSNKKGDFMILINDRPFNIETNFFDGGGSKQEIMNSYIPRAADLKATGWGFALVTDGKGWLTNRAQLEEGYWRIGNIFNIKMCLNGDLDKILEEK